MLREASRDPVRAPPVLLGRYQVSRQPTRGWRAIRGRIAVVASLALVSGALAAGPPALAAPTGSAKADKKIDAELAADFGKDSTQDFFVRFADKADLAAASKVKGCSTIAEAPPRTPVKVAGVVRRITVRPAHGFESLEAVLRRRFPAKADENVAAARAASEGTRWA